MQHIELLTLLHAADAAGTRGIISADSFRHLLTPHCGCRLDEISLSGPPRYDCAPLTVVNGHSEKLFRAELTQQPRAEVGRSPRY